MKRELLVSICCLTYNQEKYIRRCIEGFIMQQTDFEFEVLINDDASTDGTVKIIEEYAANYPDIIKPIYQKENQYSKGVPMNRSFNFPRANGEFIAICEGDDYWTDPNKLQKQVNFLRKEPEFGLIYTDIDRIDENDNTIDHFSFKNVFGLHKNTLDDFFINAWFLAPCTWVFRKNLIDYEARILPGPGDLQMLLQLAVKSKVKFFQESTANYRVLNNSVSHFNKQKDSYLFRKKVFDIQIHYATSFRPDLIDKICLKFFSDWFFSICRFEKMQLVNDAYNLLRVNNIFSFGIKLHYNARKLGVQNQLNTLIFIKNIFKNYKTPNHY